MRVFAIGKKIFRIYVWFWVTDVNTNCYDTKISFKKLSTQILKIHYNDSSIFNATFAKRREIVECRNYFRWNMYICVYIYVCALNGCCVHIETNEKDLWKHAYAISMVFQNAVHIRHSKELPQFIPQKQPRMRWECNTLLLNALWSRKSGKISHRPNSRQRRAPQ